MQLATRSLSARTLSNASGQSTEVSLYSNRSSSSTSAPCKGVKSSSVGSRRRADARKGVEPLKLPVEKGFNIAEHLRDSADNDRLRQSASADVHQLLRDISSVMRSVSPSLEPTLSPTPDLGGGGREVDGGAGTNPSKLGRRGHLRSKVAAKFSLPMDHVQRDAGSDKVPPPVMDEGVRFERRHASSDNREVNHSINRPQVPHLEIRGDPSNIGDGDPAVIGLSNNAELAVEAGEYRDLRNHHKLGVEGVIHRRSECSAPMLPTSPGEPSNIGRESSLRAASQAKEVKSLLEEKRVGLSRSRLEELERAQNEVEARERKRLEREQRRAAKLKADRMAAIAELKKRREEKRVLQERLAQEEMVRNVQ